MMPIKEILKKQIIYRSMHRGTKEMDLLLGNFVKKYIDVFDYNELLSLYEILEKNDDDIFKWYTDKKENINIPKNKVSDTLKKFKLK